MKEHRGPWYLLTGLVIGVILGLLVAWVVSPVRYSEVSPAYLAPSARAEYRRLIAAAYAASGDLRRAEARLALLGDPDPARALAEQAQQTAASGGSMEAARALALLASALGSQPGDGALDLAP